MKRENNLIIKEIDNFCLKWTKKYSFFTKLLNENCNEKIFVTEFSELLNHETVPLVSVKVYFKYAFIDEENYILTFNFEKDELIHNFKNTVNLDMMEKWLDRYFYNKNITKNKFLLATEFEKTRVHASRFDGLELKEEIKEKIIEKNEIFDNLNQSICDINYEINNKIEENNYNIVKKLSYMIFRLFDISDTGIVSNEKFKNMLFILNINLNDEQFKILKQKNHLDNNGFLYSHQCIPIIINILLGTLYFHHSLYLKDYQNNMYNHMGNLMLIYDEKKDHFDEIIQELNEKQDEQKDPINKTVFNSILSSYSNFFTVDENKIIEDVIIKDLINSENNTINYKLLKEKVFDKFSLYIGKDIEEMERNVLENYLISELGRDLELNEKDLFEKLNNLDKIKLTTIQKLIIIKKFPKLNHNNFNVNFHTFYLEKYINYLFDSMNQKRLKYLEENANYKREEKIDLYSENTLYTELITVFKKYDRDQDNQWDYHEFNDYINSLTYLNFDDDLKLRIFSMFDEFNENCIKKKDFITFGFEILKYKIANEMFEQFLKNYVITF